MHDDHILITDLITEIVHKMEELGYAKWGIWAKTEPYLKTFLRFAVANNAPFYSEDIVQRYIDHLNERFRNGEIGRRHRDMLRYEVNRLKAYYDIGCLEPIYPKRGSKYVLSETYQALHDGFLRSVNVSEKAKSDMSWAVRRYLFYLQNHSVPSLEASSVETAREFIVEMSMEMKMGSLKNLVGYLRQFQQFLLENNIAGPDCSLLFSSKIRRTYPISGYVHDDELEKILTAVDTETSTGKRDYAIIMLGAILGIRACDIIHLKFSDIDWQKKELRFMQAKTINPIVLPLTPEVESALVEYIRNGRPHADHPEIFLRAAAPVGPIRSATAIQFMFTKYASKANIDRKPYDGKNFHGLRRRLGRNMILNDVPLTTIAQVLGHQSFDATKQYLSLDSQNLRECALDFRGISVERRGLNA